MKSEFIVRPGGNPNNIRMDYNGAASCFSLPMGEMQVQSPLGYLEESAPVSWEKNGKHVRTRFVINGTTTTFAVDDYDRAQTLVIDPWATYHGGSQTDYLMALDVDATGNIYASGFTNSINFTVKSGTQMSVAGNYDAVLVKYANSGTLLWSTYYGGSGNDGASGVAVDNSGNPLITGGTQSSNFPVFNAIQSNLSGASDAFIVKFSSTGAPVWGTYFGGSGRDGDWSLGLEGGGVGVDLSGRIYICHSTESTNLPVLNANQSVLSGTEDAFMAKFSPTGALHWATYLGGSGNEEPRACVATGQQTVAVVGNTTSSNFPLLHPLQTTYQGNPNDAFIAEYDSSGTLLWSSYISGNATDGGWAITKDNQNAIYVALTSGSTNLPLVNSLQSHAGGYDTYICKYSATATPANGRSIAYATYWGGSKAEHPGR